MLLLKAFHIITMVAWFAGLFYLPRLFVYHAQTIDSISVERFKIMERRLYYGITWPAALLTTGLGIALIGYSPAYYLSQGWMHTKLFLVVLLWVYHAACGAVVRRFAHDKNTKSPGFFRVFNEIPTIFLIAIVLLVVCKPW